MKRKNFDLENSNKHWNINEIAFLEFCRRKDLSYKEIAKLLNISVNTVEGQMGIALKKLRANLRPLYLWLIFAV